MSARLISKDDKTPSDYTVKFVVVGEPGAGKSSAMSVISGSTFGVSHDPTIGIEFFMLRGVGDPVDTLTAIIPEGHDPRLHCSHYKIQVWDCAGQRKFRSIVKSYFRGAHVVISIFDVTNRDSFDAVRGWIEDVRGNFADDGAELVMGLLGNKTDLPREVSEQEALTLAQSMKLDFYFDVSAAWNVNLTEAMNKALTLVHHRVISGDLKLLHRDDIPLDRDRTVRLSDIRPPRDPKCADCF